MPLVRKTPGGPQSAPPPDDARQRLKIGDAAQRWSAARALASAPDGLDALAAALASEPEPRVREAILTALTRWPGPASVAAILPHLRADDASLRTAALDALRAMPAATAAALPALLGDEDPDVRLLSCEIARALGGETGAHLMADLLRREIEVNVCASAVEVLAEIGGSEQVESLAACATRFPAEPFLAFAIRAAIRRIGDGGEPRG